MEDIISQKNKLSQEGRRAANVFAVGGGKGGVGKTVITASLGTGLAQLGKRVILVDADFTGANLHAALGIDKPGRTSFQFFNQECEDLSELLLDHPGIANLKLLSAPIGALGAGNMAFSVKEKFIRSIGQLNADFIIMDLGAGNSYNVLDFFLAADQGILIATPDPLSVLEVYNFIKLALFRRIARTFGKNNGVAEIIKQAARTESHKTQTAMNRLYEAMHALDPALADELEDIIAEFQPMLLINMLNEQTDEKKILEVKLAVQGILAVDVHYIGAVRKDEAVMLSLEKKTPFIACDVKSPASRDLATIIIIELLRYNKMQYLRDKFILNRRLRQIEEPKSDRAVCSINCLLWKDCGFKNGGYPCELMQLSSLNHFR